MKVHVKVNVIVQVSEVDIYGRVLATFTDVSLPVYLSLDSECRVLVADCYNNRIVLLNSRLQLLLVTARFYYYYYDDDDYDYYYDYYYYTQQSHSTAEQSTRTPARPHRPRH